MYGLCRITDLGISHFNFSSKNQASKVYKCFGKIVVLATQSTTKLVLQYLDLTAILYRFYMVQPKHTKGEESFCQKTPGTF
jgi:hypothetical protein